MADNDVGANLAQPPGGDTPMTANPVHTESAQTMSADIRLCDHCGRPLPALHKDEYTQTRAMLVATAGFCVCPSAEGEGVAGIPEHGPSLL
ncbi:MAG: hypothetical protein QOI74_1571 [Micromonosporaceae bacterium]|jgi:hypothetical protein|nr:hypothetical protein [Micromonosporaceae bacterium]MDT5036721.1 hypothetical protein [Micromonosporaceae bacterium]